MVAKALLVTLLAAAACLAAAQVPKDPPYNTVAAAANPENYKGYSSWPLTIKELLKVSDCATDDTIFNLDFIECNLWFIEELAAGKPSISKVHCSKDCATQWGKISRACYNGFRAHLTGSPTFASEAKEFFGECDVEVPKLTFDEDKPKVQKGVNFASAKGQDVQAASLAPVPRVDQKQMTDPAPAEDPAAADTGAGMGADMADAFAADAPMPEFVDTFDGAVTDVLGGFPAPPTTVLDWINQTSVDLGDGVPTLLDLVQEAGLEGALGGLFRGSFFAPDSATLGFLVQAAEATNTTLTPELLKAVLTYHVSNDLVTADQLNSTVKEIKTLNDKAAPLKVVVVDPASGYIDIQGVGSQAVWVAAEPVGDAVVHTINGVLLPEKGALADELAKITGFGAVAPEVLPTEPVVAGAAANLASAAALAAGLLAAALLA